MLIIQQVLPDRKKMDPDSDLKEPQVRRSISSPDYRPGGNTQNGSNKNGALQSSATGRLASFTNMYGKHKKNRKDKNNTNHDTDNNNNSSVADNTDGDGNGNVKSSPVALSSSRRRASVAGEGEKRANTRGGVKQGETFPERPSGAEEDIDAVECAESATEDFCNNLLRKNFSIFSGGPRSSVFSGNRDNNRASNNSSLPFFRKDRNRTSGENKDEELRYVEIGVKCFLKTSEVEDEFQEIALRYSNPDAIDHSTEI